MTTLDFDRMMVQATSLPLTAKTIPNRSLDFSFQTASGQLAMESHYVFLYSMN